MHRNVAGGPFRFPVQLVLSRITSSVDMRGRSSRAPSDRAIESPPGRQAAALGSSASSPTTAILAIGFAPMSVTLTLDDEIDISRGDVLTVEPAFVGQRFEAELVWMDERPLDPGPCLPAQAQHANGHG